MGLHGFVSDVRISYPNCQLKIIEGYDGKNMKVCVLVRDPGGVTDRMLETIRNDLMAHSTILALQEVLPWHEGSEYELAVSAFQEVFSQEFL